MYLRNIDLMLDLGKSIRLEHNRDFMTGSRCIVSMFERLLGRYKNDVCKKINMHCGNNAERPIKTVDGFCDVYLDFTESDLKNFKFKGDYEKKVAYLELLMNGIKKVSNEYGWDTKIFEDVYNQIIQLNYENMWQWKKAVCSPSRKYKAELILEHEIPYIHFNLIIKDKNNEILTERILLSEIPDEYSYAYHLGKLKWLSNYEIALINRLNSQMIVVNLENILS
ncbi:MAG: hypothetical protein IJA12_06605 [Oscillospiraceae bacterium]|nr:hypothetical protein [Oscillospiraceae bacterium]